ncbi:MAG: hypothetical protein U9R05_07725 [Chloroflexota bacterium]|nr:hypothetical protein [Chloroflexota bacterium]
MIHLTDTKRELELVTSQAKIIKVADMRPKKLRSPHSSYAHLMTMLAQGWQIEPPVYVRLRWHSRSRSKETREGNTCHFVLWHGDKVNLVSVRDCPQIQQFLTDNGLAIDRL